MPLNDYFTFHYSIAYMLPSVLWACRVEDRMQFQIERVHKVCGLIKRRNLLLIFVCFGHLEHCENQELKVMPVWVQQSQCEQCESVSD